MGLWLKKDGEFVPVSGGAGGGDAGPHDHDDYLPLEGGTLTGDLRVDGQIKAAVGTAALPGIAFTDSAWSGFYYDAASIHTSVQGQSRLQVGVAGTTVTGDLMVDGTLLFPGETRIYANTTDPNWNGLRGRVGGTQAFDFYDAVHPNIIYRNLRVLAHDGEAGDLQVDGTATVNGDVLVGFRIKSEYTRDNPATSGAPPNLHISTNGYLYKSDPGSMFAFTASKLTRDSDVLERAETATLPPEMQTDDDGNVSNTAEIEAHDTVQLFDVVTALLAKVKELTARIEQLEA